MDRMFVSHAPNACAEDLAHQVVVSGEWALMEVIKVKWNYKGGAQSNRISVLLRRGSETRTHPLPFEDAVRK